MTRALSVAIVVLGLMFVFSDGRVRAEEQNFSDPDAAIEGAIGLLDGKAIRDVDISLLIKIREILDQILLRFPASDIAVQILFEDTISGLDVAELNLLLASGSPEIYTVDEKGSIADESIEYNSPAAAILTPNTFVPLGRPSEIHSEEAALPIVEYQEFVGEVDDPDLLFLAEGLNRCVVKDDVFSLGSVVEVKFVLDHLGKLDGIPELVDVDGDSSLSRSLFIAAVNVLDTCGPYPRQYADHSFLGKFGSEGLLSLAKAEVSRKEWPAADRTQHEGLSLTRPQLAEIQARLLSVGFDPNGVDGIFGAGTRAAISDWQRSEDIPVSGYLNSGQLGHLEQTTETAFVNWRSSSVNADLLAKASQPIARGTVSRLPSGWYRDGRGYYCRQIILGTWCQVSRPTR